MPQLTHLLRLGRAYKSYVAQDLEVSHPPSKLWIEPTAVCNLRCVMCPQSLPKPFSKGYMPWDLFTKIIDEARGFAFEINLFHRGESTLHPKLPEMIRYIKDGGVHVRLHSNGTFLDEARSVALIESGLDVLSFSFDGYTSEAYEKIRVLGRFTKTVDNIVRLLQIKKRLRAPTPYVILETIDFSVGSPTAEQVAEQRAFRGRFADLPLDRFVVKRPHNWAGTYEPGDPATEGVRRAFSPCTFPWYALVVFYDGTVSPCPQDWYGDLALGNLKERTLLEVWNGPKMLELRRHMKQKDVACLSPCNECDMLWRPTLFGVPTTYMKEFLKANVLSFTQ